MPAQPCRAPTDEGHCPGMSAAATGTCPVCARQVVCCRNGCTQVNAPNDNWCATCNHPTKPTVPTQATARILAANGVSSLDACLWENDDRTVGVPRSLENQ